MTQPHAPGPWSTAPAGAAAPGQPQQQQPTARRAPRGGLPAWSWVVLALAFVVGIAGSVVIGTELGESARRDLQQVDPGQGGPGRPGGPDDGPSDA